MGCTTSKSTNGGAAPVQRERPPSKLAAARRRAAVKLPSGVEAATRLQAVQRGRLARRAAAGMSHPRPCPRYRVNTAADTFGACRCGWSKNEHTPEALHYAAAKTELKRVDSSVLRSKMTFSYNPEHKEVSKSRKVIRDAAEVRAGFMQRGKIECARFVVDVEASEFGMCICGGHRADHTEEALKPQGALGTKADSDRDEALRLRMTGRERVDCNLYEVDVSPDVPFGTCRACGFRRAQHSPEALIAAATAKGALNTNVDEATVRAKMQARRAKCDALAPGA